MIDGKYTQEEIDFMREYDTKLYHKKLNIYKNSEMAPEEAEYKALWHIL